jgi:hypothetical protein
VQCVGLARTGCSAFRGAIREEDVMNKTLTGVTASAAGAGLVLASTSAKAFVPVVLAAIIGGSVLGGAVLGSAAVNNANTYTTNGRTVVATTAPGVTVGSTTCYFTHAWVGNVWQRVRVCNNY